ncbi:MAG TPA: HAD-IA family hydrolase [Ktedonobacterales bacterium]|jgi:putative hydrolase of the HAD superfamily|nr:HAD-IA family hydrolase [Ktedonobacterales bacterium]
MTSVSRDPLQTIPHPQSIRTVFLDVGFTLLAPHPSVVEIAISVCASLGRAVDRERLTAALPEAETTLRAMAAADSALWSDERAIRRLWTAYFTTLLGAALLPDQASQQERLVTAVVEAFEHASSYRLYPDVVPALRRLREHGLQLGVISDWGIGLGLILRHHDLIDYFDFAVVSAAVRHSKPDPALFQTALARANAIPDYAVHVGDAYLLDVLGARAAGITPVLLDRARRYDAAQLDCPVIHDLYGLLTLLEIPHDPTE